MSETDRIHDHSANDTGVDRRPSKLLSFMFVCVALELFEFLYQEILINLRGLNGSYSNLFWIIICVAILGLLKATKLLSKSYCIYYLLVQILENVWNNPEVIYLLRQIFRKIKED